MSKYNTGFISDEKIWGLLEEARENPLDPQELQAAIHAVEREGALSLELVAQILQSSDPAVEEALFQASRAVKQRIYGSRIVLFAPLYISNYCVNSCTYCGYRCKNPISRKSLTMEEIAEEVRLLEQMGHKRLALEAGEDPLNCPIEYVLDAISTIYDTAADKGIIRRVNVNIAATTVEEYRLLKEAGIGTYVLFQETYHRDTYEKVHPRGPKHDYLWHLFAMDRAMEGGIDDVGLGILFGLYDYRYEVLGLLFHAYHLEQEFGVGPHTVSVPRLRMAPGVNLENYPHLVTDHELKKIVALFRLALPYTGIIISTRETPQLRGELLELGVSQISGGSRTDVGGYAKAHEDSAQFEVADHRTLDEVVQDLLKRGFLPSFCTACYRQGRTGDRFMELAKTGEIQNVCQPNALFTLQEYLCDYASPATRELGSRFIQGELDKLNNRNQVRKIEEALARINSGTRDIYW
ncbi:MAG TPA: [FeFe] hydrogenase H-cluster radical SAM maturase HydG [Firmicutes bacterium]|nr:[FeFe] hydrogenase H-cluster radical SAM maturase HydG [Bacillota bacterium]